MKTLTDNDLVSIYDNFLSAMNEDFNTPVAFVELNNLIKLVSKNLDNKDYLCQVNYIIKN